MYIFENLAVEATGSGKAYTVQGPKLQEHNPYSDTYFLYVYSIWNTEILPCSLGCSRISIARCRGSIHSAKDHGGNIFYIRIPYGYPV
jgi:hypothetical protein